MKIEDIHKEITDLFKKYKYPWLTLNLSMKNLHKWSIATSERLKLNEKDFQDAMSELFWSLSHVQLALGYMLIARNSCKFPKGINGTAYQEEDIPSIGLPEIHFCYHSSFSIECIYRCWERMALVLLKACYPKCSSKFYFNGVVNKIDKDGNYNRNPKLYNLKKQIKHWDKVAGIRNELSHGTGSSPMKNIKIEGEISNIYGLRGERILKGKYSSKNLIEETNKIKDKYLKLLPAMKAVIEFIDNIRA